MPTKPERDPNERRAYYLKLGKGGEWAADSIEQGVARIGWTNTPLQDILDKRWRRIKAALRREKTKRKGKAAGAAPAALGAATADYQALRRFCESGPDDIWVTFHDSKLWWGHLKDGPIQEDSTSKFRRLAGRWSCQSKTGRPLLANQIPGRLSQMQGFRATICRVKHADILRRVINGDPSPEVLALDRATEELAQAVTEAIRSLHWKDFELLVDLVFRQSGWRRTSALGETMKSVDLELQEPITADRYQVQIKSRATRAEAEKYKAEVEKDQGDLSSRAFRRMYFVVHSPEGDFSEGLDSDAFKMIFPERLGRWVVEAGLTRWLKDRVA